MDAELPGRVRAGEKAAVATALNLVEDRRPEAREQVAALLAALHGDERATGQRIGLTGPPGVGKSTLAASLARALRDDGRSVGIVAVDPSSIRSGGALLGDRARMRFDPADPSVFVRSLATGGEAGGLSWAANAAVRVLAAAYETVIVETTGVGQTETDVVQVADTVVLVVQPGSGDTLQFLKAGIMEIPDVVAVNKADQGVVAQQAVADLRHAFEALRVAGAADAAPALVATTATLGDGVDDLLVAIDEHREVLGPEGIAARRRAGAIAWARALVLRRGGELGTSALGGEASLRARIEAAIDTGEAPNTLAAKLGEEIVSRLIDEQ